jgi:cyclohexanecarboxylate-CoA ligase
MATTRLTAELIHEFTDSGAWRGNYIDAYLSEAAREVPTRTAIADRGRTWTFVEFNAVVDALAAALQHHGVGHGDVVSWQLPNWAEACAVHLATIRIGAISNPIIPIYRHSETRFILEQAGSKIVFGPSVFRGFDYAEMYAELLPALADLQSVVVTGATATRPHEIAFDDFIDDFRGREPEPVDRDANDLVLLLYTSGTTSAPKGAMHTHNSLDYENRSIIELLDLSETDVVFMPSPVGHITGILYGIQLPPMVRSGVALLDIWEPAAGLHLIQQNRCTTTVAATPFLYGLVHHPSIGAMDISSMRNFLCGGADVPPDLITAATTSLDCMVARVYGSTEYPTATSSNATDALPKRADTDGRAIGQARVRVVDEHDADVVGDIGEVLLRGPEMFVGYLDASLNRDAFTHDGWFRTGDLGRLDAEGYLEITGRKKDLIIRGGENLSAKEVEDHLFAHPKISEVAIVGSPDPVLGERVCAVVVPESGADVSLDEVIGWLLERQIAKQKLPEDLIVLDQMPRTASGKIQKFKLRDLAAVRHEEGAPT